MHAPSAWWSRSGSLWITRHFMKQLKTQDLITAVERTKNFGVRQDNLNYMYGWMRSFIEHLESTVPGVKEQVQQELEGIQRTGRVDHTTRQ